MVKYVYSPQLSYWKLLLFYGIQNCKMLMQLHKRPELVDIEFVVLYPNLSVRETIPRITITRY